ncbi:hypothetical protein PMAA_000840 [Talaromyces marneffei ATCC 18224]|uniref:Uncharacterized protein n=1 Tax=Talaromyces marneffei (strain ATCC 18224 / CBS 334.59 / QM 7333) TaxID=441960 RepID=B6QSA6_TALMQ|nr:hypothetical protein PMAA_000840 [Talaromyces marneffei ATCC 18224]
MNWETFYDERTLFLLDSNYAIIQQAFVPGSSRILDESLLVNNLVTAHQRIHYATNIPKNENVSRREATEAFKKHVTDLMKTPKTELHNAIRALKEMTIFLGENSKPLKSTRNNRRLSVAEMEAMGEFLIKFCDGIARHGLVDYEMGVWEEEILDLIARCIDKHQAENAADSGPPKA